MQTDTATTYQESRIITKFFTFFIVTVKQYDVDLHMILL